MTNALNTLAIGTVLIAANDTKHEVLGFLEGVFFARLLGHNDGVAYAWTAEGKSISLGSDWDFPHFAFTVPHGGVYGELPVLSSVNGSKHQPVFSVYTGEDWLLYCITANHLTGGAYPWTLLGEAVWAGPHKANWAIPELDLMSTEEDNDMVYDEPEADLSEGLPALEALSDYLSVLMDGKLTGDEILAQILTAYQADEDR